MNEQDERSGLRGIVKLLLVLGFLALGTLTMMYLVKNPVTASKQEKMEVVPRVEVVELKEQDYPVQISAQGQVEATTMTMLVSEVAGAIEYISPKLKAGGHFEEGETLLKVSQADYLALLEQNRSAVADAELQIAQEEARAEQALRDWRRLGRGGSPSALVRRVPQLKSAHARLLAAKAQVVKTERDLAKTEITAPYACLVASSTVDKGGYLSPAGRVAEIYAAGKVQVRLPLSLEDVGYLTKDLVGVKVAISAEVGGETKKWDGHVVRTEGVVDRATHTMMTVVEVSAADVKGIFGVPPVGMFVEGDFQGEVFKNVMRVPRVALRSGETVWVVNEQSKLDIQEVEVERSEREYVFVVKGLTDGARVITSPIELPVDGMTVEVIESPQQE